MNSQKYTLRRATMCDVTRIAELTRLAWSNTAPAASGGHQETDQRVREDLESGGCLVLERHMVLIGSVRWFSDSIANAWEVMRLGIAPSFRGCGYGLHLMNEVARLAQIDAVPELRIFVEVGQPQLISWYERQGFVISETPEYARRGTETPPIMLRRILK